MPQFPLLCNEVNSNTQDDVRVKSVITCGLLPSVPGTHCCWWSLRGQRSRGAPAATTATPALPCELRPQREPGWLVLDLVSHEGGTLSQACSDSRGAGDTGGLGVSCLPRLPAVTSLPVQWVPIALFLRICLCRPLSVLFFFFKFFICWFWRAGPCCCMWAFSGGGEQRLVSSCGLRASHCGGFSCRARALGPAGSVVVAFGLSCSKACAIFPDQGQNPCPLYWHADS